MARKKSVRMITRNTEDPGMVQRLEDQLSVQKIAKQIHENRRKLDERAFYPAHDKRLETPEYRKIHHHLTVELDLPCLVCGVKRSTLNDKSKNRYRAKQMETHHHVIEWALANAIDADKFNATLLPHLKQRHGNKGGYEKHAFTQEDVRDWVDHSPDNLWVLCDVHHRAPHFGIHEITFPIWGPMDLLIRDFEAYVKAQIDAEKKVKISAKKRNTMPLKKKAATSR